MVRVHQHGCDWRYFFNASKNSHFWCMGKQKRRGVEGPTIECFVYEAIEYMKECTMIMWALNPVSKVMVTLERQKKIPARKVLNMTTNVGIRKGGLKSQNL